MATELCRRDTAFVAEDAAGRWTIGNERISKTVRWAADMGFGAVELAHRATGHAWHADGPELELQWSGTTLTGRDARAANATATTDDRGVELAVTLELGEDLAVTARYRCAPGTAAIQQWIEVAAQAAGQLRATSTPLAVQRSEPAVLRWVKGLGTEGAVSPTGEYISFRLQEAVLGRQRIESGARSTQHEIPWFVLGSAAPGEGLFVGLQYAAQWAADAAHADGTLSLALGPTGISFDLGAGGRWVGPKVFTGVYAGYLDDAAAAQQRFYRAVLSPPLPADFPWVQYNTWFSYFCDFDADTLRREAALAADLGVEIFYVDAGWWVGNPRRGSNFSSGLGNWRPTPEKFPSGLRAFADDVRGLGMRFGLWVEPERVDLRTAATGSWHTEWLIQQAGKYGRVHWPSDTETAWLCFGHAPTRAWAVEWISELVRDLGIAWLKWDSNWWGVCDATHHDHGAGDGEYHQVAGVLEVLAELRRRFPELIIENCAGGGSRMDFAFAEQTHTAWVNDWSEPSHRVRFHLAGAGYPFPPEVLNTWVTESALEDLNHRQLPRPALDAIFRSRMPGAVGISCRIGEWPAETRDAMRDAIAEYKQLRPLLRAGQVRHLLPQPELRMPGLPTPAAWEAFEVLDAAAGRGTMLVFRGISAEDEQTVVPTGLDASASYRVTYEGGTAETRSGAELMRDGIRCTILPLASTMVQLEAVAPESAHE